MMKHNNIRHLKTLGLKREDEKNLFWLVFRSGGNLKNFVNQVMQLDEPSRSDYIGQLLNKDVCKQFENGLR